MFDSECADTVNIVPGDRQMVQQMPGHFGWSNQFPRDDVACMQDPLKGQGHVDKYATYLSAFVYKQMTCTIARRVDVKSYSPFFDELSGEGGRSTGDRNTLSARLFCG